MNKRLFLGCEIHAPWPEKWPAGRLLEPQFRHMTFVFFGDVPYAPLLSQINEMPKPPFHVGISGWFDSCLLLPHVVAWHMKEPGGLCSYQKQLSAWFSSLGYCLDERNWLAHVTLARSPFQEETWLHDFHPLPCYASSLHLYESVGNLTYLPVWSHNIAAPFEEVDHTADMAFKVRGESLIQIYQNAWTALAFKSPELLNQHVLYESFGSIEEVIDALNKGIAQADGTFGCPFKAVSFHGDLEQLEYFTEWEMIVDV